MTATTYNEDREACTTAGMNGHIDKQVNPKKLLETLLTWLSKSKLR